MRIAFGKDNNICIYNYNIIIIIITYYYKIIVSNHLAKICSLGKKTCYKTAKKINIYEKRLISEQERERYEMVMNFSSELPSKTSENRNIFSTPK